MHAYISANAYISVTVGRFLRTYCVILTLVFIIQRLSTATISCRKLGTYITLALSPQKHLRRQEYLRRATGSVSNVALPKTLGDVVAALTAAIGSRIVEMLATRSLIIHGLRVLRFVKVLRLRIRSKHRFKSCSVVREQ